MIRITCPCGQTLQTGDEHAGKVIRCPQCQGKLTVPSGQEDDFVPVAMVEAVRSGPAPYNAPPPIPRERREREERGPRRGAYTPPEATSGKAVFCLILGIVAVVGALVLGFFAPMWMAIIPSVVGLGALVIGLLAMSDVKQGRGRLTGQGMALSGLIAGVMAIPLFFPGYLINSSPRGMRASAARVQETNNLKQIGLAMHFHHDMNKKLPDPGNVDPATGRPLLSWRVHILPFIEQEHLYRQFRLNEPWDSPHNLALANQMPMVYRPVGKAAPANHTTYQLLVGPNTIYRNWPPKGPGQWTGGVRLMQMTDGTSNTLMVVESSNPVLWTKPQDIDFNPSGPLPSLGWSTPDRFLAVFGDGSTRTLSRDLPPHVLRALIDPSDGQVIFHEELER
jgi:hypothetical protein